MHAADLLLSILDCPDCRSGQGLVPQREASGEYLACASCQFLFPIIDEVIVLLPAANNPRGRRGEIGRQQPLSLERAAPRAVDMKALTYSFYARMDEFGRAFDVKAEPVVVDVGCSTGSFACWLASEQTYIGFDLSFESLRFARRASGQFFVQADAHRLPIKANAVPFAVSREILEHLDDSLAAARELCRVARRGAVVVPTLDFPFLYDPLNWVLKRRGKRMNFGAYGYGHKKLHDIAGWRGLLEQAGLRICRERPIGTGLVLNATDVVWHSLYSWRDFDNLPRRASPLTLLAPLAAFTRAAHRLDSRLMPRAAISHAFAIEPAAPRAG
jgi:SAM-dependent methyltransferase